MSSSTLLRTDEVSVNGLMTQKVAKQVLDSGRSAFLTGPPGAGKSYLVKQFVDDARRTKTVAVTASTGIAGTHIGGTTLHSWAGLGVRDNYSPKVIEDIAGKPWVAKRVRDADVLIIDEVSMLHRTTFEAADAVCRSVKRNDLAFGGMQVVLCGDFYQLPPVTKGAVAEFIYGCETWEELDPAILYLGEQFRQSDDSLLEILHAMRDGELSQQHLEVLSGRINGSLDDGVVPTRLHTHNVNVDAVNQAELSKLQSAATRYRMTTYGPEKLVEPLRKSCLAPEVLDLKIGAAVMFVKNNLSEGYINGTLGTVIDFDNNMPKVRTDRGVEIVVQPQTWDSEDARGKVVASLRQLPLRLAWAISVHKSQGMSLSAAEIDLSRAFVEGLGYVALSRVTALAGIRLLGLNAQALAVSSTARGIDKELRDASAVVLRELRQEKSKRKTKP